MGLLAELKRRNVIRVGLAYVVGAWLLLQVTDVLVDLLGLPDTAGKYVVLLLVVGFPLALFFAWAFELTPEGLRREAEVDRSDSIAHQTSRKLDRGIIVVLAIAVAFFAYDKLTAQRSTPSPQQAAVAPAETPTQSLPGAADPSIAVLPFVNMSADPDQEYFSDGIAEELLNLLVRVDGLKVASRTSSFIYKGENLNIPAIASELKVNHILEGSVRKADNRVRITAQLIDVPSDRHLWSDTFDRELDDIFAIQDEIANAIVNALKEELGIGLESVTVETATENLDAYDLYLKGRDLFINRQNLDVAIAALEQATRIDPGFTEAWETLAAAHLVSASWLAGDGIDHFTLSRNAAHKALELNPNLSMAYAVLSNVPSADWSYVYAGDLLDTAIANDPKNATAALWRGINLIELGYFERAIKNFESCLAIDPGYLNCKQHMSMAYLYWGKIDKAVQLFEETIAENFHSTDDIFVSHYLKRGDRMTAFLLGNVSVFERYAPIIDWIEAIENPQQDQAASLARWERWANAQNFSVCRIRGLFVALRIDHCYSKVFEGGMAMIWHPDAEYFRNTPAFNQLINEYHMSYWKQHGFPPQCRDLGAGQVQCSGPQTLGSE